MAFMNSEVLDKQLWLAVDTAQGIWNIPDDLFNAADIRKILDNPSALYDAIGEYTEAFKPDHIYGAELIRAYGVRLSAAGYMDCTEWEIFTNKREALQRARELDRESEGEDDF